ncbi:glutamate racemase [Candidatus Parcubacteria bacterium]|nr:MAG: glutamate racemase [Candidatus Parcubacteria bacterium]
MIGIFDSGIGGLSVAKKIYEKLPQYQTIYFGDTARTPYGNRSQELIYRFTEQAVDFLFKQGCELIIIACNTASAEALRKIQQEFLPKNYPDKKVLGVIRPVAEAVAENKKSKRVGVVGTRGTINSGSYVREIKSFNPGIEIFQQSAPLLVPLIEEGFIKRRETKMILKSYLRPLKLQKIDTLVLGCTHYPFLHKQFKEVMGKSCKVLDTPEIVADKLTDYLSRHPEIESKLKKGNSHKFLVTDVTEKFKENAQNWLGREINLEVARLA